MSPGNSHLLLFKETLSALIQTPVIAGSIGHGTRQGSEGHVQNKWAQTLHTVVESKDQEINYKNSNNTAIIFTLVGLWGLSV